MPEGGNVAGGESAGVTADAPAPARNSSSVERIGNRMRFTVELRPGETTIVSWKKLVKDANKAKAGDSSAVATDTAAASTTVNATVSRTEEPVAAVPTLEARLGSGQPDANEDAAAPHRFSAVIEKIERLYMGKDSSDEEDLNDIPDDDQYDTEDSFIDDAELDEYFQVDKSKTKHDGYFVNRGTLEKLMEPSEPANQEPKKRRRKDIVKGAGNDDDAQRPNKLVKAGKKGTGKSLSSEKRVLPTSEGPSVKSAVDPKPQSHQKTAADGGCLTLAETSGNQKSGILSTKNIGSKLKEVGGSGEKIESMHKSHSLINTFEESEIVVQQKDKSTMCEKIDLNLPDSKHSMQPVKNSVIHKKEGSSAKSKVNVLEKAVRELEKMVAEMRPPAPDAQDGDPSSQSIKRRLPEEIKQKLAKVSRLAHASNGKVTKELLSRLMGSLGQFCQVRTMKRHMNITTSLSAMQEKDGKFQRIKKEVIEMVKERVPSLMSKAAEQQSGGSGDLQQSAHMEKAAKGKLFMDATLEDKICDLYDTFVDGLDEDVAPQVRKLYSELAELWPKGVMDNHGIKNAICRAKERRRTLNETNKDQEKVRRKKVVATKTEDTVRVEPNFAAESQHVDTKVSTDLNITAPTQQSLLSPTLETGTTIAPMSTGPTSSSATNVSNPNRPKQEKVKGTHNSSLSDAKNVDGNGTGVKKKVKKRAVSLAQEGHLHPEKLSSHQVDDQPKKHKHSSVAVQGVVHKSSVDKHSSGSHQGVPQKSTPDGFRVEPLT